MELTKILKLGTMGFKPDDIKKIKSSGIETDEIIKLAENGYSVKDVDELITLTQEEAESLTQEEAESLQPGNEADKHEPELPEDEGAKSELDYKEDLEKSRKENEDLKAMVKKLQEQNAHKNLGPVETETHEEKFKKALVTLY